MLWTTYLLDKAMRNAISPDEDFNQLFEDSCLEHIPGDPGETNFHVEEHQPVTCRYRLRSHSGAAIGVAVTILAREVDIAARKALEALWIAFKNPAINRKEERVTQELAPFADLCGLSPGGHQPEGR
ncbi:unnamed protein product [Heligmosomoides polygyrus]|uniref:Chalcone synthase n=1 Tax=Heligmosomoides polygyrus TaxID=6339 RepID=A0A183GKQ0_HELPZ|nr:unnamed protein product [Heligmosomoides polygyrus]